jgi:hypothetical protein
MRIALKTVKEFAEKENSPHLANFVLFIRPDVEFYEQSARELE